MRIIEQSLDNDHIARFIIEGDSGKEYCVELDGDTGATLCDCPRHVYKKEVCKHIKFILSNLDRIDFKKLMEVRSMKMLKSGCTTIDTLLGGGFPYGMVTSVTSEPNIGKTKLGLQLALANIKETGKKSIIIETEGEAIDDQKAILKRFAPRYGLDNFMDKIVYYQPLGDTKEFGIQKLMRLFGYDLKLDMSNGGKFSTSFAQIKPQLNEKLLSESSFILIDSITTPIKESVGSETQNLPARAAIIQRLYGKLYQFAKTYNLAIVVNHHTSTNPVMPFGKDLGKMYGGSPVLYNSKYAIQLLPSTSKIKKDKFQGFELEARRVRLIRHPFNVADGQLFDIRLKKDFGFVDL